MTDEDRGVLRSMHDGHGPAGVRGHPAERTPCRQVVARGEPGHHDRGRFEPRRVAAEHQVLAHRRGDVAEGGVLPYRLDLRLLTAAITVVAAPNDMPRMPIRSSARPAREPVPRAEDVEILLAAAELRSSSSESPWSR